MIPSPHPVISMFITRLRRSPRLIVIVTIMLNLVPFFNGHALAAQSSATITLSHSTSQTITIPPAKSGIPLVHSSQTAKVGLHPNSPAIPNYSGYLPNLNIGATLSNPTVHTIFFGFDKNSSSDNQRIDGIVNFLQGLSGTGIAGVLNQYVGSDQMSYDSKKLFDISPIPTSGTCGGVPNYSQDDISSHIFSLSVGLHWNPTNSVVLFYLGSQANYDNCGCGVHSSVIVPTGVQAFAILPPVDIYNTMSNSYPCLSDATLSRYYTNRYNLNELGTWPWYAYGSVTLHELFEAITDPYWNYGLFAWIDGNGQEIGDVCPEPGGASVSWGTIHVGNGDYYVQRIWSNNADGCMLPGMFERIGGTSEIPPSPPSQSQSINLTTPMPPTTPTGPTNPTYADHAEYVIGSDHQMSLYLYQPSTYWQKSSVSGTTATLQGSVASYLINGCHFAFAIDTSNHLQEYYRCALTGSWSHQDLSSALGVTFTGSPQSYAFIDPATNGVHHSINVVGINGHFYNVYYTPATNWKVTDVASGTFTGKPSGYAVVNSTYFELVYLVGMNGGVYEYQHTSSGWVLLNNFPTLTSGVTAAGSLSAYPYTDSNGVLNHSFYVVGTNGHLFNFVYKPSTNWRSYDISGSDVALTGTPQANVSYQTPTLHFVYVQTTSGNLEELYSVDGTNTWSKQSLGNSGMNGAAASYSYIPANTSTNTHIVFYPESDGHLHETYYHYPANWQYQDLGTTASGATVTSAASGYGF